jgi:hypothetical protein
VLDRDPVGEFVARLVEVAPVARGGQAALLAEYSTSRYGSIRTSVMSSSTSRPRMRWTTHARSPGSRQRVADSTRTSRGQYSGQLTGSVM